MARVRLERTKFDAADERNRLYAIISGLEQENARLKRENETLRALVDAWMGCGTRYHTMSGACPMFDPDAPDFCKASQMARELGIKDAGMENQS